MRRLEETEFRKADRTVGVNRIYFPNYITAVQSEVQSLNVIVATYSMSGVN